MISLSVTDLDSFRRYRENEEMSLGDLLRQLRRQDAPSPAMLAGTALHSFLEDISADEGCSIRAVAIEGHRFIFTLDANVALWPFRELRGRKTFEIGGEEVQLRSRVDAFNGMGIADHKLTQHFDAERYLGRYQWRAYLSIFGADQFTYNVFVGKATTDDPLEWTIFDYHQLTLYRYPELEADLQCELAKYVDFAKRYLTPKTFVVEAA